MAKKKSWLEYTKATALKNYRKWTQDQDLLKSLLSDEQATFTDEEIQSIVSKELKRISEEKIRNEIEKRFTPCQYNS